MGKKKTPLKRKRPLWQGPKVDGISQSLMGRALVDMERFRLLVVEGIREQEDYSHKLEYGNMWQICEEYHAMGKSWKSPLKEYVKELLLKWQGHAEPINKWYQICRRQFPVYLDHYREHADTHCSETIETELEFEVPYELPSGREVLLRGKMDEVFLRNDEIWIGENKCKGDVNEETMRSELPMELQTMTYRVCAEELINEGVLPDKKIAGVQYNVVRRPLSDWRGSFNIKQRKGRKTKKGIVGAETPDQFYDRVRDLIQEHASHFFLRWKTVISAPDVDKFKNRFFEPFLEYLWDWWEYILEDPFNPWRPDNKLHWQTPYGIYNPLLLGRQSEFQNYLLTGSELNIEKVDSLFRELSPQKPTVGAKG